MWLFWVVWLPPGQSLWHQAFPDSGHKFVNYHLIFSFTFRIHQTHPLLFIWLNEWILPLLRGKLQNWDVLSFTHSLPSTLYSHFSMAWPYEFSLQDLFQHLPCPSLMNGKPCESRDFCQVGTPLDWSLENRAWHLEMLIHIHHGTEDTVE